jgi:ABC-type Fe3+-hydroxamate transport system substrate-binding protein
MKKEFTDQMGNPVIMEWPPERIVSLVPSQTELLADLGLEKEVAGITKFCVHPGSWFRTKDRVGGTKKLNFARIADLNPGLVIGNKEENEKEQIEELRRNYPVWMSDIRNLEDAIDMIQKVGEMVNRKEQAYELCNKILSGFSALRKGEKNRSCAYLIWQDPYMAAGQGTFINDMLARMGLENIFSPGRYPEFTAEELSILDPDIIFLSSEPFPFSEKHREAFRNICPRSEVMLVDGEMFSWYGSRLLRAPGYFSGLLKEI